MNISPQDQAISVLNQMITETNNLLATQVRLSALHAQWTNFAVATKVNAFNTAPLLTTGAYDTADGSPNVAHPVDTRVYTTLIAGISPNNFAGIDTFLQGVATVIGGGAVGANGAAVQLTALTKT